MPSRNPEPGKPQASVPLLPLRNGVLFPGTIITLPVGRERSVALLKAIQAGHIIGVGVQRDRRTENPGIADLLPIATYARVRHIAATAPEQYRVVLEGLSRFRIEAIVSSEPFWRVNAAPVDEIITEVAAASALAEALLERVRQVAPSLSEEAQKALSAQETRHNPGMVADVVASALGLPSDKEAEVLVALDIAERLRLVHRLIAEAQAMAEIRSKIGQEVQRELTKGQREVLLRQQLKAIQKELGEDESQDDLEGLKKKLDEASLPEEARKVADRELHRMQGMSPGQPEQHVIRTYLELISELPWSKRAEVKIDINEVAKKLDEDHYGLVDVKKRILEHLAVTQRTKNSKGAILCFVGPPGVGKTSLGQSIADATGRPFVRTALGGIRDEAEVRGHRRTYVGALPGRIIAALRNAKVKNPVLLLDEVDKLGQGWMGSPESALLEVLDPEQNKAFNDHYLELPFDLSEVFFICTANSVDNLAPAMRDRLEIIELQGYTSDEKLHIARNHLIPKRLEEHGLTPNELTFTDDALSACIADYTREAGVRQLTRELTKVCRVVTLDLARATDGKTQNINVTASDLHRYLGKEKFFNEAAERTSLPGVATGLSWSPAGGDILFIECSRMPGKGNIEITGQLGDVMKESARAALTYIRSHAAELGIETKFLETQDVHIHVPAGAIPKDGPSAGVTIFTALASLLSNRRVRGDTAMTGECTLRGHVLPVGGIKTKVLAAHRAGIARLILPAKNRRDLDEVPEVVQSALEFIFVDDMGQVLNAALEPAVSQPVESSPAVLPLTTAHAVQEPGHMA